VTGAILVSVPALLLMNQVHSAEATESFLYTLPRELSEVKYGDYYKFLDEILRPYFTLPEELSSNCTSCHAPTLENQLLKLEPRVLEKGPIELPKDLNKSEPPAEEVEEDLGW